MEIHRPTSVVEKSIGITEIAMPLDSTRYYVPPPQQPPESSEIAFDLGEWLFRQALHAVRLLIAPVRTVALVFSPDWCPMWISLYDNDYGTTRAEFGRRFRKIWLG